MMIFLEIVFQKNKPVHTISLLASYLVAFKTTY